MPAIEQERPQLFPSPELRLGSEHRTNYGSFGQEMLVRTHHTELGVVRKTAGISLPYPAEVRREDVIDIMKFATSAEDLDVKGWNGVQKGRIESFSVDRQRINPTHEIKRFVAATRIILGERYGQTPEERTEDMNKYFQLLDTIWDFSDEVAVDAANILDNPGNTGWQAYNEKYFQKGIILIEGRQVNGVVFGNPPFGGEPTPILDVAIDEPHRLWLKDGYIAEMDSTIEDKIIANCEDTETVKDCRGSRGCSEFFDIMANGINKISDSIQETYGGVKKAFIKVVDSFGGMHYVCSACKKAQESCICK